MALDGFSIESIKPHRDLTSAQMANQVDQLVAIDSEFKIKGVSDLAGKKGVKRREGDGSAGGGGFSGSLTQNKEENEEEENQSGFSEKDFENTDPKEFSVRINPKTEMVELYNNTSSRIVETISAEDLMSLISRMDSASGVLINKKI